MGDTSNGRIYTIYIYIYRVFVYGKVLNMDVPRKILNEKLHLNFQNTSNLTKDGDIKKQTSDFNFLNSSKYDHDQQKAVKN